MHVSLTTAVLTYNYIALNFTIVTTLHLTDSFVAIATIIALTYPRVFAI